MSLSPGTPLGPYAIVSQLGSGGMGVVYLAHDPRLDRHVAIKLLPPDLTRDETAKQRFLQEAKAASALDHPNICTIHEINETDDGQLYLVMAHYEGETLKERIARGPLNLDDAIDIATQVGQGLAEAHGPGIVHRDIKPANLLVTKSGVVKILDFGLAKLAGTEGVTQTGTTVGTVAYMSPEQARGQEVDHRTDIWSLGVVLYEMLAGTPPFQGENLLSISNAILEKEQAPLSGSSSSAQSVVTRTLRKDRAQRFQSVADVLGDLRSLQSSPDTRSVAAATQAAEPSIAVLPFVNMSADPEQEYFCDGLAEELIDALARLAGLRVVARTSAFAFKGQAKDLRNVGKQLDVKTVLEGSVRKAGNRLRINAQLINVEDGYHLWSERYDREMDDVFAVQDEIARTVVEKLKVKLLGESDVPMVKRSIDNLDAYNLCLKGRYYQWRLTGAALEKGLECFTQALALEPGYAQARAGVAQIQSTRAALSFVRPHDVMPEAKEAALKAIEIDEAVADAHFALAAVLQLYEWNWVQAEREFRRTLELNPADTYARSNLAQLLAKVGRAEDAVAEARHAITLDPLSLHSRYQLSLVLLLARQFEEASAEARAGIELDPNYSWFHQSLGWALAGQGRYDDAVEACRQALSLAPRDPLSQAFLGWEMGRAGRDEEALTILEGLERRRSQEYVGGCLLAYVSVGLGNHDQAIFWLQEAAEDRDGLMTFSSSTLILDPLRSDPRFQALLRRMSFPAQP